MSAVYRLKASEIDSKFLENIKATFGDQEIQILITEVDETRCLLESEANKNRLLVAIRNVENRQNLVEINLEELP